MNLTIKKCPKCKIEKPVTEFGRHKRYSDGLQFWCKACQKVSADNNREARRESGRRSYWKHIESRRERDRKRAKEYRKNRPEVYKNKRLKYFYNITLEDFKRIVNEQDGKCSICGTTAPGGRHNEWHVDHDHECCPRAKKTCGKCIRGILCGKCNHGLGNFQSPEVLASAIDYLLSYKQKKDNEKSSNQFTT